jgi:hypothetical protein
MNNIKLQGSTDAAKLAHAEVILNRLARRSQKVMTVATPFLPVSCILSTIPTGGEIYMYFSPLSGIIKSICFEADWAELVKADLDVTVVRHTAQGVHLVVKSGLNEMDTRVIIERGDKVLFTLSNIDSRKRNGVDTMPNQIFLGFCIDPSIVTMQKEQLAIDGIEGAASEILSN